MHTMFTRDMKFRGFKLTLSPKGDIDQEAVKYVHKYVQTNCKYAYVVLEHGESGQRHLHALLLYAFPKTKRNIHDYFVRQCMKKYHPDSVMAVAVRVDILYDNKWRMEYLSKEVDRTVIYDKYNDDEESEFYATPEQQKELQDILSFNNASDSYYAEHAHRADEYLRGEGLRPTEANCFQYFQWRMFGNKDMRVIEDSRRVMQKAIALSKYIRGVSVPSENERMMLDRM